LLRIALAMSLAVGVFEGSATADTSTPLSGDPDDASGVAGTR